MPRIRVTDLTPREEQLAALLTRPRTAEEIARLMRLKNADLARMWVSKFKRKRSILVRFRYGATEYVLDQGAEGHPLDTPG